MLTLDQAATIIDTALAAARRAGLKPLCIVVLDAGGHMLALKRDERASFARPQIATAKAAGCLGLGFGGRAGQHLAARPGAGRRRGADSRCGRSIAGSGRRDRRHLGQ